MTICPTDQTSNEKQALLVAQRSGSHHFGDMRDALRARGWRIKSETLQQAAPVFVPDHMIRDADVILHPESNPHNANDLYDRARSSGTPTALLMDGVLEYANTFLNPHAGANFLRRAPADLVFALGRHDRAILKALGNRAYATGLPRLENFGDRVQQYRQNTERSGLLVATANQAWFTPGGRTRLIESLIAIRDAAALRSIPVFWRISHDLSAELGVEVCLEQLPLTLAKSFAVVTSASTLAIESMAASLPTAILHPHPWPLWIPCSVLYTGVSAAGWDDDRAAMRALHGIDHAANAAANRSTNNALGGRSPLSVETPYELFDALVNPNRERDQLQQRILKHCLSQRATHKITRYLDRALAVRSRTESVSRDECMKPCNTGELQSALEKLRSKGATRIAIAHDSGPNPEVQGVAQQRPAHLAGFIVASPTSDTDVFYGIKTAHWRRMRQELNPDAILLIEPEIDPTILAALHWSVPDGIPLTSYAPKGQTFTETRKVISLAKQIADHAEVRTTLAEDICPGTRSVDAGELFHEPRPGMILLKGDELDFELYRRARPWREAGTVVHSIRWDEAELGAPERFASIVNSLGDTAYALYGGGLHTRRLLRYSSIPRFPDLILDDACDDGTMINGIPVVRPDHVSVEQVRAVVVSSREHETLIWQRSSFLRSKGIDVYRLYDRFEQACVGIPGAPSA